MFLVPVNITYTSYECPLSDAALTRPPTYPSRAMLYGLVWRSAKDTGTHIPSKVQDFLGYHKIAIHSNDFKGNISALCLDISVVSSRTVLPLDWVRVWVVLDVLLNLAANLRVLKIII